jgi:uncharacterized protein
VSRSRARARRQHAQRDPQPASAQAAPAEQRVVAISCVYAALSLAFLEYFGRPEYFAHVFPSVVWRHFGLYPHLWWALWTIALFLVVPALIVRFAFAQRLRDYGLNLALQRRHLWLYVGLFVAVVPLVLLASRRADFQATYPFYRGALQASAGEILAWEAAYLTQFLALEFFFRGFLVLGLSRIVGRASIWLAMIPYAMLHYHKPAPEAFAAIVAGVVLGEVAYRTRSIAGGVIVHVGVAGTMELLALGAFRSVS